jgi:hypothetical protein
MQNTLYVLKDQITVNGQSYDCETSESDCYNAMKAYFSSSPGSDEMMDVCETIVDKVAVDRELEQVGSTILKGDCDCRAATGSINPIRVVDSPKPNLLRHQGGSGPTRCMW